VTGELTGGNMNAVRRGIRSQKTRAFRPQME
jgi:hypothetical protein